jgi:hypothetical protein
MPAVAHIEGVVQSLIETPRRGAGDELLVEVGVLAPRLRRIRTPIIIRRICMLRALRIKPELFSLAGRNSTSSGH